MASLVYNTAAKEMWDDTVDLLNDPIKVALLGTATVYSPNVDDDVADTGGAADALDAEISATNYTGGWGGAGRKTLASKTITADKTNDRAEFDAADVTWTSLGGAANATIEAAILIKEGVANDTTTRLIAYIDLTNTTTDGSNFSIQWDAEGILQLRTV